MISTPTTFVLGAGASSSFGFPTGLKLRTDIISRLRSEPIIQTLKELNFSADDISNFRDAFLQSGKVSVDAFLEHRTEYLEIGKAAIAEALIGHEHPAKPYEDGNNWLMSLYKLMNAAFDEFGNNKVSFVTFNYDRLLEYFLFNSLNHTYGKDQEDCRMALKNIPIIHLHGRMGFLPWQSNDDTRPYSSTINVDAIKVCMKNIKIIHEDISDGRDKDFENAKRCIKQSERVYFLGFGYDETNMERLGVRDIPPGKALGTAYHIQGAAARKRIKAVAPNIDLVAWNHDCNEFLSQFVE